MGSENERMNIEFEYTTDCNPLVTIIIPSYNHAKWISNAIDSVLNQTYQNIELIIVDDCSQDNSKEVIIRYTSDPRVKAIFKEKNSGQSQSINLALNVAKGEYVSFLPSDDWYLPEKTALQVEKFAHLPLNVGVVYGRGQRFFEDTKKIVNVDLPMHKGNVLTKFITEGNFVYPVTPMFRRSALDQVVFDESYCAEGESVYIKIAAKFEFDYVNEIIAVMRAHTYNTGSEIETMYADNARWWLEFFCNVELPPDVHRLKNIPLARTHRLYGLSLITFRRSFDAGRSALIQAIKHKPVLFFDPKVVAAILLTLMPRSLANTILNIKEKRNISEKKERYV